MEKKVNQILAVIRVRGPTMIAAKINDTMKMLRLYKVNNCIVVPNQPNYVGKILIEKKGRLAGNKPLTKDYLNSKVKITLEEFSKEFFEMKKSFKDIPGLKTFFRLNPPLKGYESGGVKKPFSMGGALGYRKNHINELIRRMI